MASAPVMRGSQCTYAGERTRSEGRDRESCDRAAGSSREPAGIAKKTPPPPPVPFAKQQQAMAAHPGQPLASRNCRPHPATTAAAHPMVKIAPPGKPTSRPWALRQPAW